MMEFSDLATYAGAGAAGGGGVGGLFYWLIQRLFKRQDMLEAKLDRLSEERVKNLETQVVDLQGDVSDSVKRSATHKANQDNLIGWMKKVDMKLDNVQSSTDTMKGVVESQARWLQNINNDLQKHITDYDIHAKK